MFVMCSRGLWLQKLVGTESTYDFEPGWLLAPLPPPQSTLNPLPARPRVHSLKLQLVVLKQRQQLHGVDAELDQVGDLQGANDVQDVAATVLPRRVAI